MLVSMVRWYRMELFYHLYKQKPCLIINLRTIILKIQKIQIDI
jgi:hypothetical protein